MGSMWLVTLARDFVRSFYSLEVVLEQINVSNQMKEPNVVMEHINIPDQYIRPYERAFLSICP